MRNILNLKLETTIKSLKTGPGLNMTKTLLVLGLIWTLSLNPTHAERTKIDSIYFNSASSIILEAENNLEMSLPKLIGDTYVVAINEVKLGKNIAREISTDYFDLELVKSKTDDRGFWSFNNLVELRIKPKKQADYEVHTRAVLEGLAYELNLVELDEDHIEQTISLEEDSFEDDLVASLGLKDTKPVEIHHLTAKINDQENHEVNEGRLDIFIKELDADIASQLDLNSEYKTVSQEKQDSTALMHLADTLVAQGHQEQAIKAYREALELNPENHDAHLALAEASQDEAEQLNNYLASVDDDALMAISDQWFEQGRKSKDMKSIAKGLVAYQFAILKNPHKAEYRLNYARALEKSGPAFYEQAAKRYLEAAVLAKKQYLAGLDSQEELLRDATEELIRIQTSRGDFLAAAKYCNSYLGLGFTKFKNGKQIQAIIKEIESKRNPFRRYPTKLSFVSDIDINKIAIMRSMCSIDEDKHECRGQVLAYLGGFNS